MADEGSPSERNDPPTPLSGSDVPAEQLNDRSPGASKKPGFFALHKRLVLTILVICLISTAGYFRLRVDTSLEPLLPENSSARRTIIFLRDSSFAAKGVLWFRAQGDADLADLMGASDAAEKQLTASPLIKRILKPPREADALGEMLGLLDHAGEMLNADDIKVA